MDTREWLFVFSVIAVIVIALVLATRWRRERFDDIASGDFSLTDSDEENFGNELPSGGARTVGYRDHSDINRLNEEIKGRAEASKPRLSSFRPEPKVQQSLLPDPVKEPAISDSNSSKTIGSEDPPDEEVPLLLDPSDEHNQLEDESPEQNAAAEASTTSGRT